MRVMPLLSRLSRTASSHRAGIRVMTWDAVSYQCRVCHCSHVCLAPLPAAEQGYEWWLEMLCLTNVGYATAVTFVSHRFQPQSRDKSDDLRCCVLPMRGMPLQSRLSHTASNCKAGIRVMTWDAVSYQCRVCRYAFSIQLSWWKCQSCIKGTPALALRFEST
jgi:hypothetical protein